MYILVSFLVLVSSYYLFKKAAGSLDVRRFNMVSFVFYTLFGMAFMGSIAILYHFEAKGYVPEDNDLRIFGWMVVMYTMIMVPVGMLIALKLYQVKSMRKLLFWYQSCPLESQFVAGDTSFKVILYLVSGLSVLAVAYIVLSQEAIPLLNLLSGSRDYAELNQLRGSAGLKVESHRFLGSLIINFAGFSTTLAFTIYAYWKKEKGADILIWFLCILLAAFIFNIYDLVKSRVVYLLVSLFFVHCMISGKSKLKTFFLLTLICLLMMGLFSILFQGVFQGTGKSVSFLNVLINGVEVLWGRVAVAQLVGSYMCFDIFPDLHPHLLFSTTGRFIHEVFGLAYSPDYGTIVMSFFRPESFAKGVEGHMTTIFVGEAWANFGILGVLFFPLWIGFLVQSVNIYFLKLKKTPFNLALYTQITFLLTITSGIKVFYYPVGVFPYLGMVFIVLCLASILNSASKRKFQVEKHKFMLEYKKC